MKKMILTMFAVMLMTTAFAEEKSVSAVSNVEAYKWHINLNKLSKTLDLSEDQMDAVENIHHTFAAELMSASIYGRNIRKTMVDRAVENNLKWMRYVLNDKQLRTYKQLLDVTLSNRGLSK